jgi:hypothetical protein
MTGNDVDKQLSDLNDPDKVTWPDTDRLAWIVAGVREIATHKPKSSTSSENLLLVVGTKQQLPAGAIAVQDLICNMGEDGDLPGRGITVVSADRLRASRPSWRSETGPVVKHLVVDDRDPKAFYVWPGPSTQLYVEALLHRIPAEVTTLDAVLPLDDSYLNPLVSYCKFRAYAKDGENPDHAQLAIAHFNAFAAAIGIQTMRQKRASAPANSPESPMAPAVDKNGV